MPHIPVTTLDTRINLHSGSVMDYDAPSAEMIDLHDIALALSRMPRFLGHTRLMFSVAAHSLLAYVLAADEYKVSMLFHDAHEAYMGDIPSPLKNMLGPKIKVIESNIDRAIERKFYIDLTSSAFKAEKKRVDLILLELEYYALHNHNDFSLKADYILELCRLIDIVGELVGDKEASENILDSELVMLYFEKIACDHLNEECYA